MGSEEILDLLNHPAKDSPGYDTELHLMFRTIPGDLGSTDYPIMAITPSSTLTSNGSTC